MRLDIDDKYFGKLFNGDNGNTTFQLDDSFNDINRRFVCRIQKSKARGVEKDENK
jgi:hypothetical protein